MLVLDRLAKIYPNGVHALERFSAEIRLGEIVAIIGGSGCGKSTLLRAIAGLDRATSGTVTLDNIVITAPHAKIGIIFQEPRLLPWLSVADNIGFGLSDLPAKIRREKVAAAYIEGDAFHRYNRFEMRTKMAEQAECGNKHFSHFSPETNLFEELEKAFRDYGESGTGMTRHYVHDDDEAKLYGAEPGTFTEWGQLPEKSDLLFYEGLHGAVVTDSVNTAQYADLKIGVVPVINLEWIQKIHRDRVERGHSEGTIVETILGRMPDYVNFICPQFTQTDINFQRVPTVDTSNPFIARWIPTPDESMVVIRFRNPRGIDFAYLATMIDGSFMSRANSIVIPGGKLDLAMQLILTPMILQLVEKRRHAM